MGKRVADVEVLEAIKAWRGNVSAAADQLGMRAKSLYERLASLGIDHEDLLALRRAPGHTGRTGHTGHTGDPSVTGHSPHPTVPKSVGAPETEPPPVRSFPGVMTSFPVPAVDPKVKPLRLKPALLDKLRQARVRILRERNLETDENKILESFIRDEFDDWLARILGESSPAPAPPVDEGGDE